jgi:ribosomal protein S18 acetylase RimI-like enzyme
LLIHQEDHAPAGQRDAGEAVVGRIAVMAAGFGAPTAEFAAGPPPDGYDAMGPSLACALDPDVALLTGYADGRPVSTALVYRVDEIAGVTAVATAPAYRRRGFARALTWAVIRAGAARGCTCATLGGLGPVTPCTWAWASSTSVTTAPTRRRRERPRFGLGLD